MRSVRFRRVLACVAFLAVASGAAQSFAAAPQPPTREELLQMKEKQDTFRALLGAGRKAVRAGDIATGIAKLKAALRVIPNHATALGELGFAAYRMGAEHYAESLAATRAAIDVAPDDLHRGIFYYNLGLVFEAQGAAADALQAYRRSVALRPNTTVQARVDALASGRSDEGARGFESLNALCKHIRSDYAWEVPERADEPCEPGESVVTDPALGRAVIVSVAHGDDLPVDDVRYLAIERQGRWYLVDKLGENYYWNIHTNNSRTVVRFAFDTIGGQRVLWCETSTAARYSELGDNFQEDNDERVLRLCAERTGRMRCWKLALEARHAEGPVEDLPDDFYAGPKPKGPKPKETHWSVVAKVDGDGTIVLKRDGATSAPPPATHLVLGSYTLDQFLALPALKRLDF